MDLRWPLMMHISHNALQEQSDLLTYRSFEGRWNFLFCFCPSSCCNPKISKSLKSPDHFRLKSEWFKEKNIAHTHTKNCCLVFISCRISEPALIMFFFLSEWEVLYLCFLLPSLFTDVHLLSIWRQHSNAEHLLVAAIQLTFPLILHKSF